MRKSYDPLIRKLADVTNLDFYHVERMLKELIEDTIKEMNERDKKNGGL